MSKMCLILIFSSLGLFLPFQTEAQQIDPNGYNKFFYPNGQLSSEGPMRNGKPDGFWKTYHETGSLKSAGLRTNFELDSVWNFFDEEGLLAEAITYDLGIKSGLEVKFYPEGWPKESFTNEGGKRQGEAQYYYQNGNLQKTVSFVDGIEEGDGKEYDQEDGRIIALLNYRGGFVRSIERINRYDKEGLRKGHWVEYWPSGKMHVEGDYAKGKKNGVFKTYTRAGLLEKIEKYVDDVLIEDAAEAQILDIRKEYHNDGSLKMIGTYDKGSKQGVFREYDTAGNITNGIIYDNNVRVGEGVVDKTGVNQGAWIMYYATGEKRAEGTFENGKRAGNWTYYFPTGKVEQKGKFKAGKTVGPWIWYYETGELHREEFYRNGKEDGESIEYDVEGNVITQGEYVDGYKIGKWTYTVGDFYEEGEYIDDEKNGDWFAEYDNKQIKFKGEYQLGLAIGKHKYYYRNGRVQKEGKYKGGFKAGDWKHYDEAGYLILTVSHKNGVETHLDGEKIELPSESAIVRQLRENQ